MSANLLRDDGKPPTLADYERAAHDHFMLAYVENGNNWGRPRATVNQHMKQAERYQAICRRLRIMGRT